MRILVKWVTLFNHHLFEDAMPRMDPPWPSLIVPRDSQGMFPWGRLELQRLSSLCDLGWYDGGPPQRIFFRALKAFLLRCLFGWFLLLIPCYLYKRIESPDWKHNLIVFTWTFSENLKGDNKPSAQRFKRCSLYVPTRLCEGYRISQAYIMEVLAWRIIQMITFTQIQQLLFIEYSLVIKNNATSGLFGDVLLGGYRKE